MANRELKGYSNPRSRYAKKIEAQRAAEAAAKTPKNGTISSATPKKLTDYTRDDFNKLHGTNKPQPKKEVIGNALNSRKYNVADREREKEGLYKPQMADHSREASPAIRSYMKKKGITDVNEAKRRYAKGEALVKRQQAAKANAKAKAKADAINKQKQEVSSMQKLSAKPAQTLSGGVSVASATLKRPITQKTVVDDKTKKSMAKDIKKTARKANRAQKRYERTSSNKVAAKQRAKAQGLRASLADKQNAYSHIAKKGGKLCKKC